jgi:hypothetical protein
MSLLLIDTDIASFIFKGSDYADPYISLLGGHELAHNVKDFLDIPNLKLITTSPL